MSSSINVILPQATRSQIGMDGVASRGRHKTLWLLHGLSDDHTIWGRRTSIERYVAELGIAVVMPAANVSFYSNMAGGARYGEFFEEELPALARSFFPLSEKREDNFIAGLSMGGYGAMRLALTRPDLYCAAVSLSGVLDVAAFRESTDTSRQAIMRRVFGDQASELAGSKSDVLSLLETASRSVAGLPQLYACCGQQDFLLEHSRAFVAKCRELNAPLHYVENDGEHEWGYWDMMIQDALKWLPL
ncbi:esterase family protein [Cerasicoccus arenae]|nr:alpha/beta hydrolase family protein [Cerasicoccus arenae]MBK1857685.1 esterase family protein [Cerasicoccus arenae]